MFLYVIAVFIIIRIIIVVIKASNISRRNFSVNRRTRYVGGLFVNNFIDSKVLFMIRFKKVPSVGVITQIDVTAAYAFISEKMSNQLVDIHQSNMFDHNEGRAFFNLTVLELTNMRMIELGNSYVEVVYTRAHYEWAKAMLLDLAAFKIELDSAEEKVPAVIGFARAMEMN